MSNWLRCRILDCNDFEEVWTRIDGESIDYQGCSFSGRFTRKDEAFYGPGRSISNKKEIHTQTYKEGKSHGLSVDVGTDCIEITVWDNLELIYWLKIDNEGVENLVKSNDKFADLNAKHFLKNYD